MKIFFTLGRSEAEAMQDCPSFNTLAEALALCERESRYTPQGVADFKAYKVTIEEVKPE